MHNNLNYEKMSNNKPVDLVSYDNTVETTNTFNKNMNSKARQNSPCNSGNVLMQAESVDKMADTFYNITEENKALMSENEKIMKDYEKQVLINQKYEEKIKKLSQNNKKEYKAYIIITSDNNITYVRVDNEIKIIDGYVISENPFNGVYRLVDFTENENLTFIIVNYNNSCTGISLIPESSLYKPGLLSVLRAGAMVNIGVGGVPDTKLALAMAEFLQKEANNNKTYFLYPKAGWFLDRKEFYVLDNKQDLFFKLKKLHPNLPVFKKTLKQDNMFSNTPIFQGNSGIVYELALYGSVLMTLLKENGADTGFALWIPNDNRGKKFVDNFFRIWENYQSTVDISQKRQIQNMLNETKDEILVINFNNNRQDSRRNLTNLLNSFFCGTECIGLGKLEGIPVIISDNFFMLRELVEEPDRIFPLIPDSEEEFLASGTSADIVSMFISWCNQNYDFIMDILHIYIHAEYKGNVFSSLEKTFFSILLVVHIFLDKPNAKGMEKDFYKSCINIVFSEVMELKKYLKEFFAKTEFEMFQEWLSECVSSGELELKSNNDVKSDELDRNIAVYGNFGEMYFGNKAFKIVLNKGGMKDSDFMLKALAFQKVIQTETKNGDSVTYKPKCAVPHGCGRNQKRMVKFLPGMLMDKEGAEFGGELL